MAKKKTKKKDNAVAYDNAHDYTSVVKFSEIKRRRLKIGLTQAAASQIAGWSSAQVWTNMENGQRPNPQVSTLIAIVRVLGCRIEDIVNLDSIRDSKSTARKRR